jgi:S-DNA-T family DNA segregation ATPase FtsK/SpoIIIE
MARRKKDGGESAGKDGRDDGSAGSSIGFKKEVGEAILAVVFFLAAAFLLFAPFGKAGAVGDVSFRALGSLFGVGYYLAPIVLIALGVSYLRSLSRNLAIPKAIGGAVSFLSGLVLIEMLFAGNGGAIGGALAGGAVAAFGAEFGAVAMVGLAVVGAILVFDAPLSLSALGFLRKKKETAPAEPVDIKITSGGAPVAEEAAPAKKPLDEPRDADRERGDELPAANPKKGTGLIFFSSKKPAGDYQAPPLSLLDEDSGKPGVGDIKANANIIRRTLGDFGISVEMDEVSIGPSVTRFALKPAQGVKLSKIEALHKDLALALAAHPIRIEAPIPGKSLVGIEIPNTSKTMVGLGSLLKHEKFQAAPEPLLVALGKDVTGNPIFGDLAKAPHMLVAGTTGSGKSVAIHAMILSLLYRNGPDDLKFIMVDPKRVELTLYNGIPHLLSPVITDAKKAILALRWAAKEMADRYDTLERHRVRDIATYRKEVWGPYAAKRAKSPDEEPGPNDPTPMPYVAIFIDELADIMQAYPRELEAGIVRLAQMSRAVGIHLLLATQRPSVNVITGLIKANIPTRVALQVASQIDSRTIIDMPGAEKLLGRGDMLYLPADLPQPRRLQSAFASEGEIKKVVGYLAKTFETDGSLPALDLDGKVSGDLGGGPIGGSSGGFGDDEEDGDDDSMYEEAREVVVKAGRASTSFLQRRLRVGYSRAARLMDVLEERGIIGPQDGAKPREVLVRGDALTGPSPAGTGDDEDPNRDGLL